MPFSVRARSASRLAVLSAPILLFANGVLIGSDRNPNTDWLMKARYGVFMHFLPEPARGQDLIDAFDVEALAAQLSEVGAGYFVITLGQNSGWLNAANATYERRTGYARGERTSTRDLPADLIRALRPHGIKLLLYLPCQAPNEDARAQRAFGLPTGVKDQPIDVAFARRWAEVIQEWSDRYGDGVAGWWFDGGYEWVQFNEEIASVYAAAAKHGNPNAIVTFNPGVSLVRHTKAEDYTAGEIVDPFEVTPDGRWVNGSQWHALTYLGDRWGARNTRFDTPKLIEWARVVFANEGVITFDMGPSYESADGPIGTLSKGQVNQLVGLRWALE